MFMQDQQQVDLLLEKPNAGMLRIRRVQYS